MKKLSAKAKISGLTLIELLIMLALFAGIHQVAAQGTRFFRISGPSATTITAFNLNGMMVWSNALAGTNYIVQTATDLNSGGNWMDYIQIPVTAAINTNRVIDPSPPARMMFIPAGGFTIGDTLDGESDAIPASVYVSAFYMDVNLVSYSQWQSVYNWATNNGYSFNLPGLSDEVNTPVTMLDWTACMKWCNARSQMAGLTPVYYTDAGFTQIYTNGYTNTVFDEAVPYPNWTANGYRLPTEAEWEKAARGGLIGHRFPWGDTISWSQANYGAAPGALTPYGYVYDVATGIGRDPAYPGGLSPVGSFAPNGYGLYDMAGNVEEWCWDWYSDDLSSPGSPYAGGTDPRGPAPNAFPQRVIRGGDFDDVAPFARCANRGYVPSYDYDANIGFRCARGH